MIRESAFQAATYTEVAAVLFAYFGPDTLLPVTSIIAAAAGAILMFGRIILHTINRFKRAVFDRAAGARLPEPIRRSAATIRRDSAHATPGASHKAHTRTHAEKAEV